MIFRRNVRAVVLSDWGIAPWVNLILVLSLMLWVMPRFLSMTRMDVELPKAVTSDAVDKNNIVVVISGENVFYYNDQSVTLAELKQVLSRKVEQDLPLLIKVDRRASVGRITDIWDMARALGFEKVDVAADHGER